MRFVYTAAALALLSLAGCAAISRYGSRTARDGSTRYVYADPHNCGCFYVGGEKEYAELQQLRKTRIAEHERLLADDQSDRTLNEDLWNAWQPEGLVAK